MTPASPPPAPAPFVLALAAACAVALAGPSAADGDSSVGFHPAELDGAALFLESTAGLEVARCGTEACFAAGRGADTVGHYCDLEAYPEGCAHRWFGPSATLRGVGAVQADADKPGYVGDCLGGLPCVRVGAGEVQARSLELPAELGPVEGPFSLFLLVRPEAQRDDFFYFGHAGGELVQRRRGSLDLRLGVARPVEVAPEGSVRPGRWQLVEIHRDGRGAVRALVDGWNRTSGRPVAAGRFTLKHLFSIGRARAMRGDVAAVALYRRRLPEREAQAVRRHWTGVYGLSFGDGSPPPKRPGVVELDRRLWLDWTFDRVEGCTATAGGALLAALGPDCPGNAPVASPGAVGGGLRFDGVDDEVRSKGSRGAIDQLYSFTVAAWVRTLADGRWQTVFDKRDSLEDGWDLYIDPRGRGFLRVDAETLGGERVITDGEWHHLAGLFDGEGLRLYVDGQLDRSRYLGRRPPVETSREVAAGRNFAGRRDAFEGGLDEMRIYGRALDPQEIQALAAARGQAGR
ncbi:MAG: LamG domain-containing protein [Acidobacteriota bacterium]